MQADTAMASVSGSPLHFMPVDCSLLHMGEIFFGIITRRAIRAPHSASPRTGHAIGSFIDAHNDGYQPST